MSKKLTTTEFIIRAIGVHGDKYDYTNSVYTINRLPIIIMCKEHGDFSQLPLSHLQGRGCPKCGRQLRDKNCNSDTATFISKAKKVHQHKYLYTNTLYVKAMEKVLITCPVHGDFLQRPHDHLRGSGCPKCADLSKEEYRFLYYKNTPTQFYIIKYKGLYKIGITTKSVNKRYAQEVTSTDDIETLHLNYFNCYEDAYKHEQYIIKINTRYIYNGPTIFNHTYNSEVFTELIPESFL